MSDRLSRRRALRAGAGVGLTLVVAGCSFGRRSGFRTFEEGFERPLSGWETDGQVGPEAIGGFEWAVERSRERAHEGDWSLRVFTEGRHDDGTAWATRALPVEAGRRYEAEVSVRAWSETESFNVLRHLVARLGADRPRGEADFPDPARDTTGIPDAPYGGLREPLHRAAGWEPYRFGWTTPRLEADRLFLSLGVSVVWESDVVHYLDEVRVDLTPA